MPVGCPPATLAHCHPVTWVASTQKEPARIAAEDGTSGCGMRRRANRSTGRSRPGRVDQVAFSPTDLASSPPVRTTQSGSGRSIRPKPVSPPLPYRASTRTQRYLFHWTGGPGLARRRTVISFKGNELVVWPGHGGDFKTFNLGYKITEIYPIPGTDRLLATGTGTTAWPWSGLDGKDVYVLSHPRQANIGAVSPDGKYLMTASSFGLIHLGSRHR